MLFGGLDGIITTFAVVAGASACAGMQGKALMHHSLLRLAGAGGGGLSVPVVLIMGFSSLVADALSMGIGDALSSKAEGEVALKERRREMWELENYPEGEIKEMVELYTERGLDPADAQLIVQTMAKYKDFFVDVMMKDELGLDVPEEGSRDHWVSGLYCFMSFLVCGSVPLLGFVAFMPFTNDNDTLFGISCLMTALMLFILGALKSAYTTKHWWHSGLEILVMGALTATAAYAIGWGVEKILEELNLVSNSDDPGDGHGTSL